MSNQGYSGVSDQDYDVGPPEDEVKEKKWTIFKICNTIFLTCLCCCCCLLLIPLGFAFVYGVDGLHFSI
jgi:hypothetical protein